jgi:WD40 repeat protein
MQVVTGSMDCTLRVWDPRSGASTFTVQGHPYHEGPLTCLAVSPDGAVVLTGSEDKTARVVLLVRGAIDCIQSGLPCEQSRHHCA